MEIYLFKYYQRIINISDNLRDELNMNEDDEDGLIILEDLCVGYDHTFIWEKIWYNMDLFK